MLDLQYRMPPTLGRMISTTFYDGLLRNHKTQEAESCVRWIHVNGSSENDGTSCFNGAEMAQVVSLWRRLQRPPYKYAVDDVVVICFYEAQRKHLATNHPTLRVHNVDSFQGQEAPVILLTLAASYMSVFLKDRRRVNVACSRAQERLFIIGRRDLAQQQNNSCWREISNYCSVESKQTAPSPSPVLVQSECSRHQPHLSAVHLSSRRLEEILCRVLAETDGQMPLAKLGWGFVEHHRRPFRDCSAIPLEPFLRQRSDRFIVYPDAQTGALFVEQRPPHPPASRPTHPPSYSIVLIEEELLALLRAKGAAGTSLIKLGSMMGIRHGGVEFKLLAGCTMKRFLERRPLLFRLRGAANHLCTWVYLQEASSKMV